MCATCGCSSLAVLVDEPGAHAHGGGTHDHAHGDGGHTHSHDRDGDMRDRHPRAEGAVATLDVDRTETIALERAVLAKNDALAMRNRGRFVERDILALNFVSSPGSGKTTLLERTIRDRSFAFPIVVVEGDQATDNDSARIRAAGARALQVNTGSGCHLEAETVARALDALEPTRGTFLAIENVGNLVCPALFDLGERAKVAILSVTEGDDKPAKYPYMFAAADLFIINKVDLLPYVDFDVERCIAHARDVRPGIETIVLSARTGENLAAWYDWLDAARASVAREARRAVG